MNCCCRIHEFDSQNELRIPSIPLRSVTCVLYQLLRRVTWPRSKTVVSVVGVNPEWLRPAELVNSTADRRWCEYRVVWYGILFLQSFRKSYLCLALHVRNVTFDLYKYRFCNNHSLSMVHLRMNSQWRIEVSGYSWTISIQFCLRTGYTLINDLYIKLSAEFLSRRSRYRNVERKLISRIQDIRRFQIVDYI